MRSHRTAQIWKLACTSKIVLFGWIVAQIALVFLLIQYLVTDSESIELISVAPSTILLEGIEVDRPSITQVTLKNNTDEVLRFCGNNGRCSEKYCVFIVEPLPSESVQRGATVKIQIKFIPGVVGPFSEEISLYCCLQASTETVSLRVSGVAVSSPD